MRGKRTCFSAAGTALGLLAVLLLLTGPGWAQEEDRVIDIGRITVMAPQPGVEITTDKTIIHMDEFRKPGEVRSLTDVLTEIGGIDVQRINPLMASPGDEVSIRGLNEGRMVIEIDGRRINHTGHYGRFIVDWSTLNMDDVERIEIIRGGHSVLHPFAIGGVINIITKKGDAEQTRPEVKVSGGYGDYDTYNAAASIRGGTGSLLGYGLSVSKQETDGFLRNNFQDNQSINAHLNFNLPAGASLSLGVKYVDTQYGLPVLNDPDRADFDPAYPVFTQDADQLRHLSNIQFAGPPDPQWEKHTTYLDGIFEIPVGPGTFKVHGYMTEGRRWWDHWSMGAFVEDFFVDDITKGVIAEYRDVQLGPNHNLTFGLEYQELGWPDSNPIIYKVQSAYVQDVIRIGDRLTLTPGVRYYKVDMDVYYSWIDLGLGGPAFPAGGKEEDDDGFYPSLRADFQVNPKTDLYAAVSRSYRLPCP